MESNQAAPASAPAPQASAPAPSKKNKSNSTLIIVIVVILVMLGLGGYLVKKFVLNKIAEKSAEKILESATGSKVDIDGENGVTVKNGDGQISTGSKAEWPKTMPSSVPEFKYGTISYSTSTDTETYKGWSVTYSEVSDGATDKYSKNLTDKGWSLTDSVESSLIVNKTFEKDDLIIYFMTDPSSKSATVTAQVK